MIHRLDKGLLDLYRGAQDILAILSNKWYGLNKTNDNISENLILWFDMVHPHFYWEDPDDEMYPGIIKKDGMNQEVVVS